jgi:hypothetical protein
MLRLLAATLLLCSLTARADRRFAPVELSVDLKPLPDGERKALARLVEAARIMDTLFLRQVWAGNEAMLLRLAQSGSPHLRDFILYKGPWNRLDKNAPFVPGAPEKPEGGAFYPLDASKSELDTWMKKLPEAERQRASGFFTTIRRGDAGRFVIVPYSLEYQPELAQVAALLNEAANLTQQPTLRSYLQKRAAAFLSNDYYDSDVAWMALDSSIEPTIGPYEVYEDEWFNAKAAFEAFITVRDDVETQKLQKFSSELQEIEDHLPIDPKLRNPKLGAMAPIRVVNELFCSGDANHGVQTAAFNLPNDERVTREKGTKRVMLKNVQEAKFKSVLLPIAKVALDGADQKNIAFDAFFTHILMHELMHGLGPHSLVASGRPTTVRAALEDSYSAIEEAKADVSGLWALQYLIDKGTVPKTMEKSLYVTYLASSFRSLRFGITEAHGKANALQLNHLLDSGAFKVSKSGTFSVDPAKIKDGVTSLARELLTLEGHGDRAKAKDLMSRLAVVRPEVQRILDRLKDVPVDIEPKFVTADTLR